MGIDAGGTFIDYYLIDEFGQYKSYKKLRQFNELQIDIINGLVEFAVELGLGVSEFMEQVNTIVHGTTLTTNAVLTRTGARTALLTTEGLIDLLEMRQGARDDVYNNHRTPWIPLIARDLRIPIKERLNYEGATIVRFDRKKNLERIRRLKDQNIESFAIAFAHSYINPKYELEMAALIRENWPNVHISMSNEIFPRPHLYRRVSTTVLDAYVAPLLKNYLGSLPQSLKTIGFKGQLFIMQSNGGSVEVLEANQIPVKSILSGPAAGPSALKMMELNGESDEYIVMDMGGTSFEVSIIKDGYSVLDDNKSVNGHLIGVPLIDLHTIGSGGGSLAGVDLNGMLFVGPESAEAIPGPACYDLNGTHPTCTDADLLLGLINPEYFLGGRLKLKYEKSWQAIKTEIADCLGINVIQAAVGIFKLINVEMALAIKEVTLEKGFDPRHMNLFVGGGAGPIHAAYLADQLGIKKLIIPRESSVMCAAGMLNCSYRREYYKFFHKKTEGMDLAVLEETFQELWLEARENVIDFISLYIESKKVYMRYEGQHHELLVECEKDKKLDIECIQENFHQQHLKVYGYNLAGRHTEIEIVGVLLTVGGEPHYIPRSKTEGDWHVDKTLIKGHRQAYFDEMDKFINVPVYDGDTMTDGYKVNGPAIIEQKHTTVVVPSDYYLVAEMHNFTMCKMQKVLKKN